MARILYTRGAKTGGVMRAILGVIIAVAVAWGGYWFWGAAQLRSHAQAWLSEQGATGEISVIGFPNRFDLTVTNPAVQRDEIGYAAPFFQVFAMTWKPWHLIAAFAPTQDITFADQKLTLSSPHILASVLMKPFGGFALQELRLDGTQVALVSSDSWRIDAAQVTAAMDATADPLLPRIGGRLTDFTAPVPVAGLSDMIALASLDANLRLDAPLDATTTGRSILAIDIRDARLIWGDFSLTVQGSLAPDAAGLVSGDIRLDLTGGTYLPQILVALGLISPDQTGNLAKGIAAMGGSGQFHVTLSGGAIRFGPIPVAAAPRWPL